MGLSPFMSMVNPESWFLKQQRPYLIIYNIMQLVEPHCSTLLYHQSPLALPPGINICTINLFTKKKKRPLGLLQSSKPHLKLFVEEEGARVGAEQEHGGLPEGAMAGCTGLKNYPLWLLFHK